MPAKFSWMNGQLVPWADSHVHIESESVMRGATAFEAIRAYRSEDGRLGLFRVRDHLDRLFNISMRFLRMESEYGAAALTAAIGELLEANEVRDDAHVRVFAYADHVSVAPRVGDPFSSNCGVCITAKEGASEPIKPMRMTLSPWRRAADTAVPPRVKIAANNITGRIAMMDAESKGFDYPILLNETGSVAGGSAMNIFMVRDGELSTPRLTDGILEGITRDTVLSLARGRGITTVERWIDASELYVADELFLCSTGFEISPIVEVDFYLVGSGEPGPITRQLQQLYESTVRGKLAAPDGWLMPVPLCDPTPTG